MVSAQIERLQNDSAQLVSFVDDLRRDGDNHRAQKIEAKLEYLNARITEIMSTKIK